MHFACQHLESEMKNYQLRCAVILIWDCRKMTGYDKDARAQWIDALKEMKSQIDTIWLISASAFIRTGASVMGFFTNMQIKPISCESEIEV